MTVPSLSGADVYAGMMEICNLRENISKHFHFDNPLWRAIRRHIVESHDCVLINRSGPLANYRGTGYAVRLIDWYCYSNSLCDLDVFCMSIAVGYYDEDKNTYEVEYDLNVPVGLLTDFSNEKFDLWISQKKSEKDKLKTDRDLVQLGELVKTYPEHAKMVLDLISK